MHMFARYTTVNYKRRLNTLKSLHYHRRSLSTHWQVHSHDDVKDGLIPFEVATTQDPHTVLHTIVRPFITNTAIRKVWNDPQTVLARNHLLSVAVYFPLCPLLSVLHYPVWLSVIRSEHPVCLAHIYYPMNAYYTVGFYHLVILVHIILVMSLRSLLKIKDPPEFRVWCQSSCATSEIIIIKFSTGRPNEISVALPTRDEHFLFFVFFNVHIHSPVVLNNCIKK